MNFSTTLGLLCKRNGKIKFMSVSGVTKKKGKEKEVKSLQSETGKVYVV